METTEVTEVLTSQFSPLLATALLAAALTFSRFLLLRYWQTRVDSTLAERRKMKAVTRGIVLALLALGMAFIWAPELQAFALSVAAFAVALVVGMKELILAALGGLYRLITRAYKVGDWISVAGLRGEVVDFGLTSTTLEQLGPGKAGACYTGHKIVFPNSKLLTEPVTNEGTIGPYLLHTVSIPIKTTTDIDQLQAFLLAQANKIVNPDDAKFRKFVSKMSQLLDFAKHNMEPKFQLEFSDPDKGWLRLSLFLPSDQVLEAEQQLIRAYMSWCKQSETSRDD